MTIRELLNALTNSYNYIRIMEYSGDYNAIGADLETDYSTAGIYKDLRYIPQKMIYRKVEYFTLDKDDIYIYLEG